MSKAGAQASSVQLIALLLVFSLLAQSVSRPALGAALQRSAATQGRFYPIRTDTAATHRLIKTRDAGPAPSATATASGTASQGSTCPAATSSPQPTRLLYVGQFTSDCGTPLPVSAMLTDECGNALAGRRLNFAAGSQSVNAMTDDKGIARSTLLPEPATAPIPLRVNFTGDEAYSASEDSAQVRSERLDTFVTYTGKATLAAGTTETVSATLTSPTAGRPIPNASLLFEVGSVRVPATTDANGVARATVNLPASESFERAQLKITFAGDDCHNPASAATEVTAYLRTAFVIWGGNNERLRLGQRVNFWGHSWAKQVTAGDYKAHSDFKGYADTVNQAQLCQVNVRTISAPPLKDSCWSTKPGQSFPPASLPEFIGIIVTTSMDKSGARDFGNIAALVVVKVDPAPRYGADPGKPGFGSIVAVIADGEGLFPKPPALTASQSQPANALPSESLSVTLTISNSSTAAANVSVQESFKGLVPPAASAEIESLPASGSRTQTFNAKLPALEARREGESSLEYQKRLAAADGTPFSSLAQVSFRDSTGRALPPIAVASSGQLRLPRLRLSINATPCVSPGTAIPYLVRLTNVGSATAASAVALVTFPDGTKTRVEASNLEPGQVFSQTLSWTVKPIDAKGPSESTADYLARLASFDGKALRSSVSVNWKDALGNDYGAVDQECASVLRVPILAQTSQAPPPLLPGQKFTEATAVRNTGSGNAVGARLRVTNPDTSVFDVAPFSLTAGGSSSVQATLTAPAVAPKEPAETDAAYQARLQSIDNGPIDFALALEWTDAAGNVYGPVADALRTTEVLPIVLLSLSATETVEAGDTVVYQVKANNVGHAEAAQLNLSVTVPGGAVEPVQLPGGALAPGGTAGGVVNFVVPATQPEGQINAQATVNWKDALANGYGPMSASAVTNILNPNRPPIVNAGPDQTIVQPASVTLNGTASDDGRPLGSTLTVQWTKVSGPGEVAFADSRRAVTTASFSVEGMYVLRLTASDSVLSASDDATIEVMPAPSGPVYSDTGDFTRGEGVNIVPDEFKHLHINNEALPFNFIWVAVSSKGTIVKIDTNTGQVLAEYYSSPAGQPKNPSRTTVDHNGNVWASNRDGNSVLRIGLAENGQCVDRNGNGVIDTSRAQGDIRPWTNAGGVDTDGGVDTAADECIINYTRVSSSGTRHVSVNAANDVWVSGTGGQKFDLLDGATGQIKRREPSVGYGGYGGLIDKNGVIWSSRPLLRWDTALPLKGANGGNWKGWGHDSYGLCIDSKGNVWNTALNGNLIRKFAPDGTLLGSFAHGSHWAQGCVVDRKDDVWVAHSLYDRSVGHLQNDGTWLGNVAVGEGPTGVAVDRQGKIWATNHDSRTVSRIDPELGAIGTDGTTRVGQVDLTTVDLKGNLYNYSDMTGSTLSGIPASGTWTQVFDSGITGAQWGVIGWTGQVCGDGALIVKAASSTDGQQFSAPVTVANGVSLSLPAGRYLKVSVLFKRASSGESPFLYDLNVGTVGYKLPSDENPPPIVDAGPDQTATMPNFANLLGSTCDTGRLLGSLNINWEKVSGPGAVSFGNAHLPATSATFSEAGEYRLRLTAGDGNQSSSDEMTVLVLPFNDPPAVNAGADQSLILPASLTLKGTVTDDALPAGSSAAISWTKLSGPGEVSFTDPTSATTNASFSAAGEYTLRLTGNDSQLANVDDLVVKVFPPNAAPVVSAGGDRTIRLPDKATLAGTITDDDLPLGKTVTVNWTKVSGPGTVTFAKATAAATTAAFSQPGTYVLRLTATDTQLTGADELTVVVNPANQPPSVNAGSDQTITLPDAAQLSGTVNDDGLPDGATVTTTWIKVSGPGIVTFSTQNSTATTVSFSEAGAYVLRLSASDSALSRSDDVSIVVNPSPFNLPPTVNAGEDQQITLPAKASLSGLASDDKQPTGSTLSLVWTKVSGPGNVTFGNAALPVTTAAFSVAGEYVLRLTASDTALTTTDEVTITVLPINQPPVVNAGADQTINFQAAATLKGTVTDDGQPPGGSLTSLWTKVSGPGEVSFADASALATAATFSTGGKYVLRLTATDTALVRTDDLTIIVNQAPSVEAGADQTVHLPNAVSLQGTVADDALPLGKTIIVAWTKVSGPGTVTFGKPAASATSATFSEAGSYILRLSANDTLLQDSDDVAVTVLPPLPPPPSVAINSPADGSEIITRTNVVGSVSHGVWKLEYSLGPDPVSPNNNVWTAFASGSGPVTIPAPLAVLDPTLLLNGTYAIRLTATDSYGQTASATRNVVVSGQQKIGNFTVSFEDLNVPVAGLPIQLIRTYDSRDKRVGDFGVGWTLSVRNVRLEKSVELGRYWRGVINPGTLPQYCIQAARPNIVTITLPDDRVYRFQATTAKQCQAIAPIEFARFGFTPMPGTRGTLVPEAPVDVMVLGDFPGPVELLDASDPRLGTYDPTVFRFTDENGIVYVLDQEQGVRSITDRNGNRLTISRDGITHSSGKSISFTRDAQGRITQITDPLGNLLTYTYDASGDLTAFKDQENNQTSFTYNTAHYLLSIIDPRGLQPIRNEYDDQGRLISHTDATGKTITYAHNLSARQEVVTDRLGNVTLIEYDNRGNVLRQTDRLGGVTTYSYDSHDNQLSKTDPLGRTVTSTYDANDNMLSRTDALGNVARYTHNARQQLLTMTDPLGRVATNTYDSKGNLISQKWPDGAVTSLTYNANGLPRTVTDKAGNTTSLEYDRYGNLTKETDSLGGVAVSAYDAKGQRLSRTTQRTTPGGVEPLVTTFEYDARGYLLKTNYPDGTSRQEISNEVGQRVAVIDASGRRTAFTYDVRGNLVKTSYPDGTTEEASFDAEGRRVSFTDRAGRTTRFTYDGAGRLVKIMDAGGATSSSVFDAVGQLLSSTDERGNILKYEYDAAGRRTRATDALGNSSIYTYNADQSVRTITDARNQTVTFEYDAAARQTRTIYPDGTSTGVTYDAMSRETARIDQAGKRTSFEYDKVGRLVRVTDALGQATGYTYDEQGNMTSQTDAGGRRTKFEYDKSRRLIRRTLPMGMSESYTYDADGNQTRRTDFNGRVTSLVYDSMNRLVEKIPDPAFGQPKITYSYTPTGKRSRMVDASGTTTYTYDLRDRLTSKAAPAGSLSYTYDAAGNLQAIRSSHTGGANVTYTYDTLNRLASVTDQNTQTGATDYSYDAVGNLAKTVYPNGLETSYTYDSLNRLTDLSTKKSSLVASFTYTLGAAGNRVAVSEMGGRRVSYTYDDLYRLTGESIAGSPGTTGSIGYSFDTVGNRLSRNSTAAGVSSESYGYDANDRLTSETYDANGNPTVKGGRAYSYDFENRLKAIDEGAVNIVYDGDGNRVAKTVGGVTTEYLVDDLNPTGYAQVLEEIVNGSLRRVYTYGHDLISQRQLFGGEWRESYYGYDGQGSVRYLTDAGGSVTDTYDYDTFGNLIQRTGTTPNLYLYAGEQYDPDIGYIYLRARYMDQSSGRFLTMDTWRGRAFDPLSLHKYLYAHASPVDRIDPSGRLSPTMTAFFIVGLTLLLIATAALTIYVSSFALTFSNFSVPEWIVVRNTIRIISYSGVTEIGDKLLSMHLRGKIKKAPGKYANTLALWWFFNEESVIFVDQTFFTPQLTESPVDDIERADILMHEGAHVTGADEAFGMQGSENYAYTFEWRNKERIGWTRDTYGEPRIDPRDRSLRGETDLWWDAKTNIIRYAPELVAPECRPTVRQNPEDRCFP